MATESANEDEDLQAQISFELSNIDVDLNSNEDTDPSVTDVDSTTDEDSASQEMKSFREFQHRLTSQREAFDKQLENCTQLLHSTDDKIASVNQVSLTHLVEEYGVEGEDEEQFKARIYKEIDADGESDEEDFSDVSVDVEEAVEEPVEKDGPLMITDGVSQQEASSELLAIQDEPQAPPEDGGESNMVVLYKKNSLRDLQRQAREKLAMLDQRQEVVLQKVNEEQRLRMQYEQNQAELSQSDRQRRVDLVKQETEKVQKLTEEREQKLEKELKRSEGQLSALSQQFEAQIYKLEKQTEVEKNKLKAEINFITERRQLQESTAATHIQATYRGYRVRQKHGQEVKQLVEHRLQELEDQKIEEATQRIEEMKTLQRRKEEERLRTEQEKQRAKEEVEQQELQAKADKQKALQEKKEREAEEKQLEEEKKKRELERKEEEKRKKKEEKERLKKEKEEKKRLQLEQKERERKKKETEQLLLEKEIKQREEEERKQREVEERKLREEKERKLRKEAERKLGEKDINGKKETESQSVNKKQHQEEEHRRQEGEQKQTKENNLKSLNAVDERHNDNQQESVSDVNIQFEKSNSSEGKLMGSQEQTNGVQEEQPSQGQHRQNGLATNKCQEKAYKDEVKVNNVSGLKPTLVEQNGRDCTKSTRPTSSLRRSANLKTTSESQAQLLAEEKAEKEKKAKEYQSWMEERKAKMKAGVAQQLPVPVSSVPALDISQLPAKMEERRLRWIQECQPWSQMSVKAIGAPEKVKRSFKRPSSAAKKLDPVDEKVILDQSGQNCLSKVEAVQLKDLPGCRLTTLSKCKKLKAVKVTQSAVCAIDSLDSATSLLYLHLVGNAINSLHLVSSSLSYLNVTSNNLTSMRGFESCSNIRYLNMAGNKISKLANMSCYKHLHTLVMSHNELISARGVEECVTLQVVDLSANHLTNLEDIGQLCLLRTLNASANNIMAIPRLTNCVQLETLQLSDNSISSLDGLAYFWLPSLRVVDLSVNGISTLQQLHGSFNIRDLDLSNNQLIDCRNIHDSLKCCVRLEQLSLRGNPAASNDIQRRQVTAALPQLRALDGELSTHHSPLSLQSDVLLMCDNALNAFTQLEQQHHQLVGDNLAQSPGSNAELLRELDRMPHYYNAAFAMAENIRYAHEFGSMSFEIPEKPEVVNSKDLFNAKLAAVENPAEELNDVNSSSAKDQFERKLKATLESTSLKVSTENMKLLKESTSPRPTSKHARHRAKASSRSSTPRLSRQSLTTAGGAENQPIGASHPHQLSKRNHAAATKIQATWRGYSFRLRLMSALEHAKEGDEESDGEVEEVDLTSFEYNLDDDWLPPDVPHLPQRHAVLPPKPPEWRLDLEDPPVSTAWAPPVYPPADSARYLDPPLSSMSGELSHRSKREEMIAQDWGFKDSHTAELMMKRAKKLKYNSQRRKKLDKLGPMGRYELQKKILDNIEPPKVLAPVKKAAPKKEYFKALEEEARKKSWTKAAENENAIERTFEWVHTQVSDGPLGHRVDREERVSSGESQLPYMDKRLLEGGRTQLVNSPLEIMSVNSYGPSLTDSRGKSSAQTDGRNHSGATGFVHGKPPSHDRHKNKPALEKTKRKEVESFNAWGSGKKRTNR